MIVSLSHHLVKKAIQVRHRTVVITKPALSQAMGESVLELKQWSRILVNLGKHDSSFAILTSFGDTECLTVDASVFLVECALVLRTVEHWWSSLAIFLVGELLEVTKDF